MKLNKIALPVIAFATFGLVACGESGTTEQITNNYTTGMDIVASAADLPKCTADNAGEQYLVKADADVYVCTGKEWKVLGSGATASDYGCETEPLADGSGVNILCNGEVIGTVLNGAKGDAGADGKDGSAGSDGEDGVGCKVIAKTAETVTIQCGDDKFSMNLNGGSGEVITPVEGENISIEIPELSGVSQKGPFIMGTEVKGYELDGTRAFAQTGRSFTGRIETNDGKFRINSVKLVSSQVLLSATGYYRDEVSGDQSKSPITLYAITDLTDRSNVNVNLLTHLEYDRVAKMMKESDGTLKIKEAKKNAQKEIFAAFGIDATGFGFSEDLDIFGTDDQSAALLAISILLQGDRSEAELSGLLASFSKDIEEDGKWDDKAIRGTIAKWALKKIVTDSLNVFRKNVESWGLGEVPEFEKHISAFVENELGVNYFAECENGETVGLDDLAIVCKDSKWEKNYVLDERDGQLYKTVKIGDQTWMAENLNYDPGDVPDMGSDAWHGCYGDAEANCTTYGRLYTWEVAMNNAACAYGNACSSSGVQQGICPDGWHLPSNTDWNTLWTAIGGSSTAGTKLKSTSDWNSNGNGTDNYGFSVLPAGYRNLYGYFNSMGSYAYFWSSTENDGNSAYSKHFNGGDGYVIENIGSRKGYGFSVRCLKD